jgi:hypothetical protein
MKELEGYPISIQDAFDTTDMADLIKAYVTASSASLVPLLLWCSSVMVSRLVDVFAGVSRGVHDFFV